MQTFYFYELEGRARKSAAQNYGEEIRERYAKDIESIKDWLSGCSWRFTEYGERVA